MDNSLIEKELRIVMLEDSAHDAELLERELRLGGILFQAKRVETEEAFRRTLHEFSPDLILLDNELPEFSGMAGLAVAREVCPEVPLILVSGTTKDEEAFELLKEGAIDYVLKDRRARLVPAVQRAIREAGENQMRRILSSIVESAGDAILSKTLEGIITTWNPEAERMFGYTAAEIIGHPMTQFIPLDRLPEEKEILDRVRRGERIQNFETIRLHKNGIEVEVSVTISPIKDEQGKISEASKILRDITERKRLEGNLVKLNERFDLATSAAGLAIWDWDVSKNLLVWDDRMFELYGVSRNDFSGAYDAWASGLHPGDSARCNAEIQQALNGEKNFNTEFRIVWPDGGIRYIQAIAQVINDANGQPLRMIGVNTDITDRINAGIALRESEDRFRALTDTIPHMVWTARPDGAVDYFNQPMINFFGRPLEELVEWGWTKIIHPDDLSRCQESWTKSLVSGDPYHTEFRVLGAVEGYCWHLVQALPMRNEAGKIIRWFGSSTDVMARKRSEQILLESEERFRMTSQHLSKVLDSSLDAICAFDAEGRFLQVSAACEPIWGYRPDELLGTFYIDKVLPEDQPMTLESSADIMSGNPTNRFENRYLRKDGTITHIMWSAWWSEVEQKMFCVARDNTEAFHARERIAEQAELLDQTHDAIIVIDMQSQILFWSKGAERLYGWTKEEAIGQDSGILLNSADQTEREGLWAVLQHKGEWQREITHHAKDSRKVIVETRCTLVAEKQGQPKSVIAISRDITEKKKIEAQFLRAQRMESIGTLASGIAHDLNNILAPILMSVEMLKRQVQSLQALQILETLEVSAQRGADIVRQVLSFGRGVEGARMEVQPKHLLKDMEHILRDTFPKDIRLHLDVGNDLWTILGDPTQLHQVLLNLCVNARDAMPNGGNLTISVRNHLVDEQYAAMNFLSKPGNYVVLSVTDTGCGIPPEILSKIFDPFFTTKEVGKGTGLGLSTVQAIVKSHEGFMNVYSEPGKGTKFCLHLSAKSTSIEEQEDSFYAPLPRGNGELVLLIDDEMSILTITSQTLEAFGYCVLAANNGAEGIAIFAQQHKEIAAVLTDMMMPVMDGPATIYALKKINPAVKIIATSGLNSNGNTAKAVSSGVTHFLTKPYTAQTLLEELSQVIGES